jgi:hypothetical protein
MKIKFTEIQNAEFLANTLKDIKITVTLNEDGTVSVDSFKGLNIKLFNKGESYTFDANDLELIL